MLNFTSIMIGTDNPKKLGEFYTKVLGKPQWAEGDWYSWRVGDGEISVGSHSEVKGKAKNPQRLMFNLTTSEVQEEFERIEKLGATVIAKPYQIQGAWIATFADPDGNYFQLTSPWEDNKSN